MKTAICARRAAGKPGSRAPAIREALSRWYDPETLDLVSGTPVNCLLVTLTAGRVALLLE